MGKSIRVAIAAGAVMLVVAAGCSSSSKPSSTSPTSGGGSSSSGGGKTITVGVLTDLTGLASTNSTTFPQGIKAGVALAAKDGYTIKYDVVDTASSPATAQSWRREAGGAGSRLRRDRQLGVCL